MNKEPNYFYGPVPSRRLGFSLGVDIIPHKTCSFDCLYCQLGGGMKRTMRRFNWVDMNVFKYQLHRCIKQNPGIDCITISGSGEPTLHKNLDKIISAIKSVTCNRYPVCVITNSSLLYRKAVRDELKKADIIIPSLDSATVDSFRKINRPHKGAALSKIITGLINLRKEFKGKIYLEIMLMAGINDSRLQALALKKAIGKIKPDKVQLNLPLRPSEKKVKLPTESNIKMIAGILSSIDGLEVVKDKSPKRRGSVKRDNLCSALKRLLSIRPETARAMSESLSANVNEVSGCLKDLIRKNQVRMVKRANKVYFVNNDTGKRK
jgi:GTPase